MPPQWILIPQHSNIAYIIYTAFHLSFHRRCLINIGGRGREGVAQLTQEYEQPGDHYSPALHQLVARMLVVEPSQRLDLAAALRPGGQCRSGQWELGRTLWCGCSSRYFVW